MTQDTFQSPKLVQRFFEKIEFIPFHPCWEWNGTKSNGYASIWLNGQTRRASRLSWEIHHGRSFPVGLFALHTCDNPGCVNPDHIWIGTSSENTRDMYKKGRHPKLVSPYANSTHCPYGHERSGSNIYWYRGHRYCRPCNRRRKQESKAMRVNIA